VLCLLAGVLRVEAETGFYARLWQTENGLPNNAVQAIAQTADGYLWIGTREGLCRFDGEHFEMVPLARQGPEPSVISLLAGRDRILWAGTDGEGGFRIGNGEVQRCEPPVRGTNLSIFQMCESGDETVWLDTSGGILRWSHGAFEWRTELSTHPGQPVSPQWQKGMSSPRHPLCLDSSGKVWVLNGNLTCVDSPQPSNYFSQAGRLPYSGRSMCQDKEGAFWIGTDSAADNILIRVKDGAVKIYDRQPGPIGFPNVVFSDSAGELWVGSYQGLGRFIDEKFTPLRNLDDTRLNASYKIYVMYQDQEQNLWVGSDAGLTRLTPKRFRTFTQEDGLASDIALALCPSQDGSVWISSWGAGLSHYADGRFTVINTSNGLPSNFVMALAETHDGSLWAGVDYSGPLVRLKEGKIRVYEQKGYFGTPALYEDQRGVLWIGNRGALRTYNGTAFKRFTTENGLSDTDINAICGGQDGAVWIGAKKGLTRWREGKFENLAATDSRLKADILSLYPDREGALWIGTRGGGLLRYQGGVTREFTRKNGLYGDSIYAILEDGRTNLWLSSSRGIFRVSKAQLEAAGENTVVASISYGRSDGIPASGQFKDATQPGACKDTRGRLWFRTTQGVAMLDPDTVASNERTPPVVIQEIIANGARVAGLGAGAAPPEPILIPPGNGALELRYAALSFRAPENNRYRYKLYGEDPDWVSAGSERVARYKNLRPGRYRFQVLGCNNDGVWNLKGQTVALVLEPHFWQTWWFALLLGMAAIAAVGGTARSITRRRMQRKLNLVERQRAIECERARIARDVHDELGAKLTSISFLGGIANRNLENPAEIKRQITQISASAREAVSSLHEIVWAVNPLNDSLEGLIGHISQQVEELFENSAMELELKVPEQIPVVHVSSNLRHHLFLAAMEAANNAAKHSRAAHVWIEVGAVPEQLRIKVADDGCGFDLDEATGSVKSKPRRNGSGLANMRKRLGCIGGAVHCASAPGRGTTIEFTVSLKRDSNL
jgi:ligand-binding sensor domain-containing protein/signal transduction histidine kinase